MSQSARSTVFLEEMGVGAQWKLRQVAARPEGELAEEGIGESASPAFAMPPASAAAALAHSAEEHPSAAKPAARGAPAGESQVDAAATPPHAGRLAAAVDSRDAGDDADAAPHAGRLVAAIESRDAHADTQATPPAARATPTADSHLAAATVPPTARVAPAGEAHVPAAAPPTARATAAAEPSPPADDTTFAPVDD
jgi:DNA polymerase